MILFQQQPIRLPLQVPQGWGANPLSGVAVAPTLIACDAWDTYGAQASIAQGNFTPYQALPIGNNSPAGAISIVAIAAPPWNPNGSGSYLHVVPGGTTIPNAGTGMYLNFGNPHRSLLCGFWFRPAGFTGSGGGPFIWRWNIPSGQTYGTDIATVSLNSSGNILFNASNVFTSVPTLSMNTWYFIELYLALGTANSPTIPGEIGLNVNSVPWLAATNVTTSSGEFSVPSITFDNEFSSSNMDFGPWYIMDPGTMGMQAALSSGGNMFFNTYLPASNDSVQFTPSTGTNFSNVNSAPAGSAYNAANVQGYQDTYAFSIPPLGNIQGVSILTQAEIDAPSARVSLPVWKNGSTGQPITGVIAAGATGLLSGTYTQAQDARLLSPFTGVAFTPSEVSGLRAGIIIQD